MATLDSTISGKEELFRAHSPYSRPILHLIHLKPFTVSTSQLQKNCSTPLLSFIMNISLLLTKLIAYTYEQKEINTFFYL